MSTFRLLLPIFVLSFATSVFAQSKLECDIPGSFERNLEVTEAGDQIKVKITYPEDNVYFEHEVVGKVSEQNKIYAKMIGTSFDETKYGYISLSPSGNDPSSFENQAINYFFAPIHNMDGSLRSETGIGRILMDCKGFGELFDRVTKEMSQADVTELLQAR